MKPLAFASATAPPQGTIRAWWNWTWWTTLKRLEIQGGLIKVKIKKKKPKNSSNRLIADQKKKKKRSLAILEDLGRNTIAVSNSSAPLRVFYSRAQTHQLPVSLYKRYFWAAVSLPIDTVSPNEERVQLSFSLVQVICPLSGSWFAAAAWAGWATSAGCSGWKLAVKKSKAINKWSVLLGESQHLDWPQHLMDLCICDIHYMSEGSQKFT